MGVTLVIKQFTNHTMWNMELFQKDFQSWQGEPKKYAVKIKKVPFSFQIFKIILIFMLNNEFALRGINVFFDIRK